jgi:acyl-CoA thioester hydrolase
MEGSASDPFATSYGALIEAAMKIVQAPPGYLGRPMFTHETRIRVRYGETDQMGYVYYGDYAEYLEVGRVEALRSLGFPYKRLEEEGVMLPVHELRITYHQPARYDDLITVRTTITEAPTVRIRFTYELLDEAGRSLAEAATTLVFVDRGTMRPQRAPKALRDALQGYFQ